MGADLAINYAAQDFVEAVRSFTGGQGVELILDMVGGDYVPRNLACLAEDGRHVTIATQRGTSAEINMAVLMVRRLTLTGSTLRARPVAFKAAIAQTLLDKVWPLVADGRLRPVMDKSFPLQEAAAAHALIESRQAFGRVVLIP